MSDKLLKKGPFADGDGKYHFTTSPRKENLRRLKHNLLKIVVVMKKLWKSNHQKP